MASMEMVKNTVMVSLIFFISVVNLEAQKLLILCLVLASKKDTKSELPILRELIFELNFFLPFYF